MGTQAAGSRSDPEVVNAVIRLGHAGMGYAQIESELERLQVEGPLAGRKIVDAKTIARIVRANPPDDAPPKDTSGPWTMLESEDEDPRPILEALAATIDGTDGSIRSVSKAEAEMIVTVARAAPDLTPFLVWRIARMYVVRRLKGWPSDDLDALLAFAPWREEGDEGWPRYRRAVEQGWIVEASQQLTADLSGGWSLFGRWAWKIEWADTGNRFGYARINQSRPRRSADLDITEADLEAGAAADRR